MTDKLVDRDPYNHQHIAAAFKLLSKLMTMSITAKAKREVQKAIGNTAELTALSVVPTLPSDAIVVGSHFFVTQGLYFPDNIITRCIDCKAPLQFRPESMVTENRVCIFCATDRVIDEQAENG
jgi:hypothetical protein